MRDTCYLVHQEQRLFLTAYAMGTSFPAVKYFLERE